ncbi:MAG TPA: Eco57I restriction-modification methylase domain-containing protein, partial [Candidatus Megamonas gallistercoris]|nr:Eco57I restriction-modification methylase domain-containing protein [Candidatus Megamonas gallistercoris]
LNRPKPLPNLDCNILCGNSLMDEFEGIKLINPSELFPSKDNTILLDQSRYDGILSTLFDCQDKLFRESNHYEKEKLKKRIKNCIDDVVLFSLNQADKKILKKYNEIKNKAVLPYFLWQLEFGRIFKEKGGFDIVIGNPPYGAKVSEVDKKIYKRKYCCAKTIKGKQKGSVDTFALFIEKGFDLCIENATVNFIVPMSVISSDSMTALHNLLEQNCNVIKVSSYSNRPKQIFDAACIRTSIIMFKKTLSPIEHIYTTKLIRRSENNTIENIIKNLHFVDSIKCKIEGRYPKVGTTDEVNILTKMINNVNRIKDYYSVDGAPFYYRTAGGRYFNVVTVARTGSSQEKPFLVKSNFEKICAAIFSTSLFWFYQQVYTDGLHLKQSEVENFPVFNFESVDKSILNKVIDIYDRYVVDIEKNALEMQSSGKSSYNVSKVKTYKIRKSKNIIDELDDIIDPLYGLNYKEIEFVKNYEYEVRMKD